jgi:hypothetical protein
LTRQQGREKTTCNRHHAVSLLFANDPQLLHFFFSTDRLALRWGDDHATSKMAEDELDTGESLLVHLALDFWVEKGHGRIHDAYRYLSANRFQGLMLAMELLFAAGGCDCQNCRQRFGPVSSAWESFPQLF